MADEDDETMLVNDVALQPGPGADTSAQIVGCVPEDLRKMYDVYSYRHAASILHHSHPAEFEDVCSALRKFRLTTSDIRKPGGNESDIVKRVTTLLRANGWLETRISAHLKVSRITTTEVQRTTKTGALKTVRRSETVIQDIPNFVDGHKVDFVKNRVAFDMEWNSKDQTFDRDLYAFRAFHDCSVISAGILLTRSAALNSVFASMGKKIRRKYGASTTWIGKLLYRLNAGRNGGCPVLVFGIKPELIEDWKKP